MKKLVGALATGVLATFLVVAPQAAATAAGCEPAYIGVCLPVSTGSNDVDCTDAVVTKSSFPLVSKHNDPYKLDDVGVGDGIACEHNDKPAYTNPGYTKPPTTPPATTTPTKTPTSAPATSPTRDPSPTRPAPQTTAPVLAQTPVAGGNLPWIGGGAAALLALGVLLLLVARRRRMRFVTSEDRPTLG